MVARTRGKQLLHRGAHGSVRRLLPRLGIARGHGIRIVPTPLQRRASRPSSAPRAHRPAKRARSTADRALSTREPASSAELTMVAKENIQTRESARASTRLAGRPAEAGPARREAPSNNWQPAPNRGDPFKTNDISIRSLARFGEHTPAVLRPWVASDR
jgi:hypothetical protein